MTLDEMLATPEAVAPTPENLSTLLESCGQLRAQNRLLNQTIEAEGIGAMGFIAAIVNHFGGKVTLSQREMERALELGLERAEQGDGSIIIRTVRDRSQGETNDAKIALPGQPNLLLPPNG